MKYEEIEPYLIDFIKGEADEATEYRIKAYLQQNPDFQEELDELQTTLEYTQELPLAMPPPSMKLDFYAMLNEAKAAEKTQSPKVSWWTFLQNNWLRGFALASVMLFVFFTGYWSSIWFQPDFATEAQKEVSLQTAPEEDNASEELTEKSADEKSTIEEEALEESIDNDNLNEKQAEGLKESPQNTTTATKIANLSAQKKEKLGIVKDNVKEDAQPKKEREFSEIRIQTDTLGMQNNNNTYSERVGSPNPSYQDYQERSEIAEDSPRNADKRKANTLYKEMSEERTQELIENFKNSPNLSERLQSLRALASNLSENKAVQDVLFEQLKNEQETEMQFAILNVIEEKQLKRAQKTLKKMLKAPDTNANLKQRIQNVLKGL